MPTEKLQSLIDSGQVKTIGGTNEFEHVIAALKDCDEAQIVLRKGGKPYAVLVYAASDAHEGAVERTVDLMNDLGITTSN